MKGAYGHGIHEKTRKYITPVRNFSVESVAVEAVLTLA